MCDDNLLHRARLQRGIDLDEVAARTCLSPQVVQHIDEGRFDALPAGLYARSYVRAFASAVGVDAEVAVRHLEPSLPGLDDPLPALREKARGATPDWAEMLDDWSRSKAARIKALTVHALQWVDGRSRQLTMEVAAFNLGGTVPSLAPLRLPQLPARQLQPAHPVEEAQTWKRPSRVPVLRGAAACLDAAVLLLLLALIVRLTAWTSGAGVDAVLAAAGEAIAALWGVLVLLYFVMLGGVGGRTPGAAVCGLPVSMTDEPLGLRSILERAMLH